MENGTGTPPHTHVRTPNGTPRAERRFPCTGGRRLRDVTRAEMLGRRQSIGAHCLFPAGFQRRSVSALVTTLTLEKAIAAPAMTGLRKPAAASGIPTTL